MSNPGSITLPAVAGALFAGVGVAAGAMGNHALRSLIAEPLLLIYETAVRYQIYHALGLLAVAALAPHLTVRGVRLVSWLFIAGILCFCGSLYILALTGARPLGMLTPVGGTLFMAGWAVLAWHAWRARR
ncbi:MAG: DUF423 domain-containing protein [Lautropia sp.]|nr:DUF423 domain-containing protein [Lautropia sp.]